MLTISRALHDKIVAHARTDHPDEACGVIAGPAGTGRPERFIPMINAERSPTFYRFDSMEQFRVWKEMDDRDEEPVVIYHSHTATEPYPSRTDVSYASEPEAHYVLVSTRNPEAAEFRSFRIVDGEVTEEEVRVVPWAEGPQAPEAHVRAQPSVQASARPATRASALPGGEPATRASAPPGVEPNAHAGGQPGQAAGATASAEEREPE